MPSTRLIPCPTINTMIAADQAYRSRAEASIAATVLIANAMPTEDRPTARRRV